MVKTHSLQLPDRPSDYYHKHHLILDRFLIPMVTKEVKHQRIQNSETQKKNLGVLSFDRKEIGGGRRAREGEGGAVVINTFVPHLCRRSTVHTRRSKIRMRKRFFIIGVVCPVVFLCIARMSAL